MTTQKTLRFYALCTTAATTATLTLTLSTATAATDPNDLELNTNINTLMRFNPGVERSTIEKIIEELASTSGKTEKDISKELVKEAYAGAAASMDRSGGAATIPLNRAKTGNVFYTPSSTSGVVHGHSGIFVSANYVVESNPGEGVTMKSSNQILVAPGAVVQTVSVSGQHQQWAANRAKSYVGRWYNYMFVSNKSESGPMNCSQVVWAAYKFGAGIDLDGNGGSTVFPVDIRNSQYTTTVKTY